jgi:ribose transport system ATP-binding protein
MSDNPNTAAADAGYALEARRITKTFPGVKALQDVSIHLKRGSIHALLGENGAGKSTLIKVITGVHQPDSGEVLLDGKPVHIRDAHHASTLGVSVVHQERHLIPRFSVGENIMLDRLGSGALSPVDYSAIHAEAAKWLQVLGLDLDPRTRVHTLSVARMQLVEIAKALSHESRVLLMDEPTASLTPHEADSLFDLLRKLRDSGVTIVFVSHKLEEVLAICDHVTVLRDGRNACDSQPMKDMTRGDLVRLMIGRSEQIPDWESRDRSAEPPALELRGVSTELGHRDISLTLRRGEILGLYGLVGAGRSELAKAIIGLFRVTAGEIRVKGEPAHIADVATARDRYRIGYVSEDRKGEGLILIHSVIENAGITVWRRLAAKLGFLTEGTIRKAVEPAIRKLEVRTPSLHQTLGNLSGGNQQKVSVAKWIAAQAEILIVDEPSVGIDIKTKAYIHSLLRELTEGGTSILLITSDMPEMITLADRIAVIDEYRLKGEFANDRDYNRMSAEIMRLIHHEDEVAA